STLIDDIESTAVQLEELSQLGLNISIDDFGTGYSSLKYLKTLPINSLKIDRAFVSGIPDSRSDVNIVLAIIALAKAVDMSVLAEGVETQEQSQFLYEHGCDSVQGYCYAMPMPAAEVTKLLKNRHRARTPGVIEGMAS
ncbi:MAG: EAL domain-containing protein, partial [Xanthomonadales bacterium]|nr:EAL domain-containing protein [Xanthomonadales bacterium]